MSFLNKSFHKLQKKMSNTSRKNWAFASAKNERLLYVQWNAVLGADENHSAIQL